MIVNEQKQKFFEYPEHFVKVIKKSLTIYLPQILCLLWLATTVAVCLLLHHRVKHLHCDVCIIVPWVLPHL